MKKIAIISILFLAFMLRVGAIKFGLPSMNHALTTYNPDEPMSFQIMEKWNPKKLDFHPRRAFLWGGFSLYIMAPVMKIAQVTGVLKAGSREFYMANLKEADKLYIIGRLITVIFGTFSVLLIYLICSEAYGFSSGLFSSLILSFLAVHVVNSFYIRPDIIMLFFCLLAVFFSERMLVTGDTKFYFLSCFFVGMAAAAKISGAVYGVVPILAHLARPVSWKEKMEDYRFYLIPFICLVAFLLCTPYALIDFNGSHESFWSYFKTNFTLAKGTMDTGQIMLLGTGLESYFLHSLPLGSGIVFSLTSLCGVILIILNIVKAVTKKYYDNSSRLDIVFLFSGIVILRVISLPRNQMIWYTIPLIPVLVIYTARFIGFLADFSFNTPSLRYLKTAVIILILVAQSTYSFAYLKLYYEKNVREEASEWIRENIPEGKTISIARSWYWTPWIIRQYNPPYNLLKGGGDYSLLEDAVLGLGKLLGKTDYIVLTEYEYRNFINKKLKNNFPEQNKIMEKVFNGNMFIKVKELNKYPEIFGFRFNEGFPPFDWLIPNPDIIIFKRKTG